MASSTPPTGPSGAPKEGGSSPSILAKLGLKDFPRLAALITAGSLAVSGALSCNENPDTTQQNIPAKTAKADKSTEGVPSLDSQLAPGYANTQEGYVNYNISLFYEKPITVLVIPDGSTEAIVHEFNPATYQYSKTENGGVYYPQVEGKFVDASGKPFEPTGYKVEVYNEKGEKLDVGAPPENKDGLFGIDFIKKPPLAQ